MTITAKPTGPLEKVLLSIGDTEGELISPTVVQYLLDSNSNDVRLATLEATKYIVSSLSKRVDEEVGDVKVKWSQLLDNYKNLLKDFLTNPAYQTGGAGISFGGVSRTEMSRVENAPNSVGGGIRLGQFTSNSPSDRDINSVHHIRSY